LLSGSIAAGVMGPDFLFLASTNIISEVFIVGGSWLYAWSKSGVSILCRL
jgi:hypothetical protein